MSPLVINYFLVNYTIIDLTYTVFERQTLNPDCKTKIFNVLYLKPLFILDKMLLKIEIIHKSYYDGFKHKLPL